MSKLILISLAILILGGSFALAVFSLPELSFYDSFESQNTLEEASLVQLSHDPDWWLDSGARFLHESGTGKTLQGELSENDFWRITYSRTNSLDTDNGYRPQNIFRLLTKNKWKNVSEELYFRLKNYRLSRSPNRNASNGILLMVRYYDSDNLYYAGIRVDGNAVIKRKNQGVYATLAQRPIFGERKYDRISNANLIPENLWVGLKTEIQEDSSGAVRIRLFLDTKASGSWVEVLEALDDSPKVLGQAGRAGVRSDFMSVEFDDYRITGS